MRVLHAFSHRQIALDFSLIVSNSKMFDAKFMENDILYILTLVFTRSNELMNGSAALMSNRGELRI